MNTKHKMRKRRKHPNFNSKKAVRLYRGGKRVVDIAVAMGYKRGEGQNRTRAALLAAGVYKPTRNNVVQMKARGKANGGKKLTLPVPTGPEMALREVYRVAESRYKKLPFRQRSGWMEKLTGMLVSGMGEQSTVRIKPVPLPQDLNAIRGRTA